MNRKPYSQILESIAHDHVAEHTDLAAQILTQIEKGKGATMRPRMRIFVTAVLILFVLAALLASVPAVRAAIQHWFGYVPGVGLVGEGQMRVLAEPVSLRRAGIILTVEKVVIDSTRTSVLYKVEGVASETFDYNSPEKIPGCYKDAVLRLPTGDLTPLNQDGSAWQTGYEHRASYAVIPPEIDEVTFVVPCLRFVLPGKAPENWEVPLHLVPAPPDMAIFPVFEISTPVEATASSSPSPSSSGFTTEAISLTLDRAVQMDDGYLLYATVHWENTGLASLDVFDETALHLLDANGQEITFAIDGTALTPDIPVARGQTLLPIKTAPIQVSGPLTLSLDAVSVVGPVAASFTFDPGPDPQPGQTWEMDQEVDLGYGRSLRLLRATYPTPVIEGAPQRAGLLFDMDSDTGVGFAALIDRAHPAPAGGGGSYGSFSPPFSAAISYAGDFPQGPLTIEITAIGTNLSGHWQAQWTPPVSEAQAAAAPQPEACLNRTSWPLALSKHEPIPEGLRGKLALFDVPPPDYNYQIAVVNLDGTERQEVGPGGSPSLSPDGTRVVYTESPKSGPPNSLLITDLLSGSTAPLPGTARGDGGATWSPDGTQIAFTRGPSSGLIGAPGPYNVMVVNADGSDLRQLTNGSDANYALAWMPDGNHILVSTVNQAGDFLQTIDVRTGAGQRLSGVVTSGALSPDLKHMASEETLPLDKYGLSVANLDGSNHKLLANGDPYIVTMPVWSPDGKWVIVSVHDPDSNKEPNTILALIQVDTCQIIPLPDLHGYVTSWLP